VQQSKKIRIGKLDAARRHLQTAITLWFTSGDLVSIHTLASAAYEVIHSISKKRAPNRRDLLFDSDLIKDEYRDVFCSHIKRPANFFKHADRDGGSVIEFDPSLSTGFMLFALVGLEICGERKNAEERAFLWWLHLHEPALLTEEGHKLLTDHVPAVGIAAVRTLSKRDFFNLFISGQARALAPGPTAASPPRPA
jgi:hypothetical protein